MFVTVEKMFVLVMYQIIHLQNNAYSVVKNKPKIKNTRLLTFFFIDNSTLKLITH